MNNTSSATERQAPRLRPVEPEGFTKRLVTNALTDDDREYIALDEAARPTDQQVKLDLAVATIQKRLTDAQLARDRYYERNGLPPATPNAITPTGEHLAFFATGVMSAAAFVAQDLPTPAWLVDGMIPSGALGACIAAEKTGKSLFALDAGMAISTGTDFLGRTTRQANVLVIEQEGAPYALKSRIQKVCGPTPPTNLHIRHRLPMDLTNLDHLAGLQALIQELDIGLVFLGPLAQTGNIEDENSAVAFNQIAQRLNAIIEATGCTIILIHHRKKPSGTDTYAAVDSFFNTSRGSSALMAAVDVAIGLQRGREDTHGKMFVMLRDAPSWTGFYTFDSENLRISPSDEPPSRLNVHEAALISHLIENPGPQKRQDLQTALGLGQATTERTITAAIEHDKVEKVGSGPKTAYQLTPAMRERMDRNPRAENGLTLVAGGAK